MVMISVYRYWMAPSRSATMAVLVFLSLQLCFAEAVPADDESGLRIDRDGLVEVRDRKMDAREAEKLARRLARVYESKSKKFRENIRVYFSHCTFCNGTIAEVFGKFPVRTLNFCNCELTDSNVKELAAARCLQSLQFEHMSLQKLELPIIESLELLSMTDCSLEGDPLGTFGTKSRITKLDLYESKLSVPFISSLSGLRNLEYLNFENTNAEARDVLRLDKLPKLTFLGSSPKHDSAVWLAVYAKQYRGRVASMDGKIKTYIPFRHYVLDFSDSDLTDDSIKQNLSRIPVGGLDLSNTKITDKWMSAIHYFPELTWLNLSADRISDSGLSEAKVLRRLKYLDISNSDIYGEAFSSASYSKSITTLNVKNNRISAKGIRLIGLMSNLEVLSVSGTLNSSEPWSLRDLSGLKMLKKLELDHANNIRDITALSSLQKLRFLGLEDCDLTSEILDVIVRCQELKSLKIKRCKNLTRSVLESLLKNTGLQDLCVDRKSMPETEDGFVDRNGRILRITNH